MEISPIAFARSPYPSKFGVPRQPGLVGSLFTDVVLEPVFTGTAALQGIEGFGRIWLIWGFSHNMRSSGLEQPCTQVRPPRLGGSRKVGVFASRASFRPNGLGLSCVRLLETGTLDDGSSRLYLRVQGADLVDGSPVYDIKPYLAYADAFPGVAAGWTEQHGWPELELAPVQPAYLQKVPHHLRSGLFELLRQDPRPAYTRSSQPDREYWVPLDHLVCRFTVSGSLLTVTGIDVLSDSEYEHLRSTGTLARYAPAPGCGS